MTTKFTKAEVRELKSDFLNGANDNRAYLVIAESGDAVLDTRRLVMGTPVRRWNNIDIELMLPTYLSIDSLWRLLNGEEVQSLIARICDGHSVAWNGCSHAGNLTNDARVAYFRLHEMLDAA